MEDFASLLRLPLAFADSTMASESSAAVSKSKPQRVLGGFGARKAKADVVAHGHVSADKCDDIFRAAISSWGMSGTSESDRDDLKWTLAEVFVHGTSPEISWEHVTFQFKGSTFTMAPFAQVCAQNIPFANPIRVWCRDYNKAEIPLRIHSLLINPDNLELRQAATANYGTTMDNAQYCFDLAHALSYSGAALPHSDVMLINKLTAAVLTRSNDDAVMRGFAQATSNHADVIDAKGVSRQNTQPSVAPPAERSGFKPLR